jgi:hypothetical protein
MRKRIPHSRNLISWAAALTAGIALAEILLRLSFSWQPLPYLVFLHPELKDASPALMSEIKSRYPGLYEFRETSPESWTIQPDTEYTAKDDAGRESIRRVSKLGFLTPSEPDESSRQLVTLGDSFLSQRKIGSITWQLQKRVSLPVFNLSAPGWGPANYRAAFAEHARARNSPVVAIFGYENDVADAMSYRIWKQSGSRLTFLKFQASRFWLPDSEIGRHINTKNTFPDRWSHLWNLGRFVYEHFEWPRRAHATLTEYFSGPSGTYAVKLDPASIQLRTEPMEFRPGGGMDAWLAPYFEQMSALLAQIRGSGKTPVLIWIPSRERVHIPLLPADRKKAYTSLKEINGYELALG